jgi:hypothetical protein
MDNNNLEPDQAPRNHAHYHNYNEIDSTLVCVSKDCPHNNHVPSTTKKGDKINNSKDEPDQKSKDKCFRFFS